jgi:mRNA-degrading endonuclease HigB of HigAB toxin-antitoxin module
LQHDSKTNNDNYKDFRNNESVLELLSIIEVFAARNKQKYLDKIIIFFLDIAGEEFRPLVIKILYQQKCYEQALVLLTDTDRQQMDEEEKLIATELEKWKGK